MKTVLSLLVIIAISPVNSLSVRVGPEAPMLTVLSDEEYAKRGYLESGLALTNVVLSVVSVGSRDCSNTARILIGAGTLATGAVAFGLSFSDDARHPTLLAGSGILAIGSSFIVVLAPRLTEPELGLNEGIRVHPLISRSQMGLWMSRRF